LMNITGSILASWWHRRPPKERRPSGTTALVTPILLAALFLTSISCEAQSSASADRDKVFTKVERTAYFPGGTPAWKAFLGKNLRYPDAAVNNEIQADILVQFDVDE